MIGVLFVCLGNICRSPAGEALFKKMAEEMGVTGIRVASCGLVPWHQGHLPDERMREAGKQRGVAVDSLAMGFEDRFFDEFQYILAADHSILRELRSRTHDQTHLDKLFLLGDFGVTYRGQEVPDPFHGNPQDFEIALDMLEDHCKGFLAHLVEHLEES